MSQLSSKWYIGYSTGTKYELFPDIFQYSHIMSLYVGKSWGQYVFVAGPFDSHKDARLAIKGSLTPNGLWPEKR